MATGAADCSRRALHGEVTLAGKQHRVIAFQRGPITKIDKNSVTVTSADDFTATYVINDDTKIRKGQGVDIPLNASSPATGSISLRIRTGRPSRRNGSEL